MVSGFTLRVKDVLDDLKIGVADAARAQSPGIDELADSVVFQKVSPNEPIKTYLALDRILGDNETGLLKQLNDGVNLLFRTVSKSNEIVYDPDTEERKLVGIIKRELHGKYSSSLGTPDLLYSVDYTGKSFNIYKAASATLTPAQLSAAIEYQREGTQMLRRLLGSDEPIRVPLRAVYTRNPTQAGARVH